MISLNGFLLGLKFGKLASEGNCRYLRPFAELAEVCEVVIELYYQEVWLVLDNIYMRICLAPTHVTDQGLPIQHLL